jgi:hypothetical protein
VVIFVPARTLRQPDLTTMADQASTDEARIGELVKKAVG